MSETCSLLAGPAAWSAQLVLLFLVIGALVWKRWRETPRRPWHIWCLDVSKQAFSSGAAHVCGIIIATYVENKTSSASQCGWYFVVYSVDTTLGVLLAVLLHCGFIKLSGWLYKNMARDGNGENSSSFVFVLDSLQNTGSYGMPVSYTRFFIQAAEWVVSTITARVLCGVFVINSAGALQGFAIRIDSLFQGRATVELFFVMVTCPLLMNVLQAVIQDQVLKFRTYKKKRTGDTTLLLDGPDMKEISAVTLV